MTLSGSVSLYYAHRGESLEEARLALVGAPASRASENYVAGLFTLMLDARLEERVRAVVELEVPPYRDGEIVAWGQADLRPALDQAYLEVEDFLVDGLRLRAGQFDFAYRLRPHGEPFFFDADAESFFSAAPADRDLTASAGARLQYEFFPAGVVDVAVVWRDQETPLPPQEEETVALLHLSSLLSARTAMFFMIAAASGREDDALVTTLGAGVDTYAGPARRIELFGEAYYQFGRTASRLEKDAWAAQAGARAATEAGAWAELAVSYRSGDRHAGDREDSSFFSAERVERFLIVESAEFGLDLDTNLRSVQLGAGAAISERWSARVDAAWFGLDDDLRGPGGIVGRDRDVGVELDARATWAVHDQASFSLRLAYLTQSELLRALVPGGAEATWVAAVGAEARF